jgi:peptide/nickel transport system permease protein
MERAKGQIIGVKMKKNASYYQEVWQKLRGNFTAMAGLFIILFFCLIALLAYLIAPDRTPYANLQTVEIQGKQPGYSQWFLKIREDQNKKVSSLQGMMGGRPSRYKWIPINSYSVSGNRLIIDRYVDEDTSFSETYNILLLTKGKPSEIKKLFEKKSYLLGTDSFGRDILSRLIVGSRVSLLIGLAGVIISLLIGVLLGSLAGYYRGKTDAVISWFLNVNWSIPTLLLVFAITMVLGKGFWQIMLAVGLSLWVNVARLVRGQVMSVKEREYVEAARALGYSGRRILFRHILPNISGPILVLATANFATAIMLEAGLSFLGIGVQPPAVSWGLMLRENYNYIITNNPMVALLPGFAIMLLVLAFNMLGNGLRDAVDVRH